MSSAKRVEIDQLVTDFEANAADPEDNVDGTWLKDRAVQLLVAHNAAFDVRFINREMRLSGRCALIVVWVDTRGLNAKPCSAVAGALNWSAERVCRGLAGGAQLRRRHSRPRTAVSCARSTSTKITDGLIAKEGVQRSSVVLGRDGRQVIDCLRGGLLRAIRARCQI